MTNLQIFENNEFGQIRAMEINGKPYFVGVDVAKCLGYNEPHKAITRHCKGRMKHPVLDNQGVMHNSHIISEPDFYRLVFNSELPGAESFQDWVFEEVLPSIREKGFYARNEHERILKVYLLEQATEWEKTFPDDYYIQLCRLWSQDLGSKPQFFGHLTNKYIYSLLPEGVLESLKENTPNGIRLHQTLSPEVGKKHLTQVIGQVTVLMQVSATKIEFENIFDQAFKGKPRQFNLFDNY